MKLTVDRIEENIAVLEMPDGRMVEVPSIILPENAGEGAVIEIVYNEEETLKRKEDLKNRLNSLFNK